MTKQQQSHDNNPYSWKSFVDHYSALHEKDDDDDDGDSDDDDYVDYYEVAMRDQYEENDYEDRRIEFDAQCDRLRQRIGLEGSVLNAVIMLSR
jgi:hypothetical protein